MFTPFKTAVVLSIGIALAAASTCIFGATSYATSHANNYKNMPGVTQAQGKVLSFVPICSDAASATSRWEVTNENASSVDFSWNNVENMKTGTVTAPNGTTNFTTYYNAADPNNRTEFTEPNHDVPVSRNAKVEPCTPVQPPIVLCVDGTVKSNLTVTKLSQSSYSVHTVGNAPLCADVTLYLSSYTLLDDTYSGGAFGTPGSYPQEIFDSTSVVLKKDTSGEATLTVNLPEECKNIQVDLYYAPEITYVEQGGHGNQFIAGELYTKKYDCGCNHETPPVVVTPPTPVTPTPPTPVTPVTPAAVVTENATIVSSYDSTPETVALPETGGISPFLSIMSTLALGTMTYLVMFFALTRKTQN